MVLDSIRARAYAVRGDTQACLRHIGLAEDHHTTTTGGGEGWVATVATPAQLYAGTGHAAAALARRTRSGPAREDATGRLTRAVELLHPARRARATALCMAQLATLYLEAGELTEGEHWARRSLETGAGIRSVRLADHLSMMRTAAGAHADNPDMRELAADINNARTRPHAHPHTGD